MGVYAIKPRFQRLLAPCVAFCVAHHISPTALNVGGLLTSYLIALSVGLSDHMAVLLYAVPVLAFLRTALNALDGLVSRARSEASAYGEFLNETVDRVSDAVIFFAFFFVESVAPVLVGATLMLILLASYVAIVTKAAGGPRLYHGVVGKADRMIYLSLASVAVALTHTPQLFSVFLLFLCVATAVTIVERLIRARHVLVPPA